MIDSLVSLRPRWQGAGAAALGEIPARDGVVLAIARRTWMNRGASVAVSKHSATW
jgi:hypothetical protein